MMLGNTQEARLAATEWGMCGIVARAWAWQSDSLFGHWVIWESYWISQRLCLFLSFGLFVYLLTSQTTERQVVLCSFYLKGDRGKERLSHYITIMMLINEIICGRCLIKLLQGSKCPNNYSWKTKQNGKNTDLARASSWTNLTLSSSVLIMSLLFATCVVTKVGPLFSRSSVWRRWQMDRGLA